jgi:hypothetical protein
MSATATPPRPAGNRKQPRPPVSRNRQRVIVAGGATIAVIAMVLAATYQADTDASQPVLTGTVGVDLIPGYAASLIINGQTLAAEELNNVESAGRTLDQYTYGPEPDCPNGVLLRPQNNTVQACVYRIVDGPESCELTQPFAFDAL